MHRRWCAPQAPRSRANGSTSPAPAPRGHPSFIAPPRCGRPSTLGRTPLRWPRDAAARRHAVPDVQCPGCGTSRSARELPSSYSTTVSGRISGKKRPPRLACPRLRPIPPMAIRARARHRPAVIDRWIELVSEPSTGIRPPRWACWCSTCAARCARARRRWRRYWGCMLCCRRAARRKPAGKSHGGAPAAPRSRANDPTGPVRA